MPFRKVEVCGDRSWLEQYHPQERIQIGHVVYVGLKAPDQKLVEHTLDLRGAPLDGKAADAPALERSKPVAHAVRIGRQALDKPPIATVRPALTQTGEATQEGAEPEIDRIMIDTFLEALSEVALAVAARDSEADQTDEQD